MKSRISEVVSTACTVVVAVCAVIVTLKVTKADPSSAPGDRAFRNSSQIVADWKKFASAGHRFGSPSAPVTLTVFSDFECPYCGAAAGAIRKVRSVYPQGVAVVFRHFPLPGHRHAMAAARAAECAGAQGRFEAFHDQLFSHQRDIGGTAWRQFAVAAGVPSIGEFDKCVADTMPVIAIDKDEAAARELGVRGTPTILLNERRLAGAVPDSTLLREVSTILKSHGS